ncbi:MAG: protein-glutamine gamma-glutamyltransferase [Actinomycetota bacterium]|nr:protein-glutamine gamma-glutamyltransferase [Actinomycetota bacterium]
MRPVPGTVPSCPAGDDLALRTAVTLAALGAHGALTSAGLLSPAAGALLGTCALCCSGANRVRDLHSGPGQIRLACWIVLTGATVLLTCADWARGPSGSPLGPALAGFVCATLLELDGTRRAALAHLCLSLAVLSLAVGLSPGFHLAPWIVVTTGAGLGALARAGTLAALRAGGTVMARRPVGGGRGPGALAALRTDGVDVLVSGVVCLLLLGCALQFLPVGEPGPTRAGAPGVPGGQGRRLRGYVGGGLDLRARGHLPDTPVLSVPADSPSLWRTGSLEIYTGRSWQTYPRFADDSDLGAGESAVTADPTEGLPADVDRSPLLRTDDVRPLTGDRALLAAPGVPVRVLPRGGGQLRRLSDGRLLISTEADSGYSVTSLPRGRTGPTGTPRPGAGPSGTSRGDQPSGLASGPWTKLPEGVPRRVRDLGLELAGGSRVFGSGRTLDTVRRVEDHLRDRLRYRLDSAVPEPGRDAVDDVLFGSREGFCEQFASAEVVLLRAAGIPSRLAVGFVGGAAEGDRRILRERDAHSWVEVWVPGTGWRWSDPTAGASAAEGNDQEGPSWRWLPTRFVPPAVLLLFVARDRVLPGRRRRRVRTGPGGSQARGPGDDSTDLLAAFARLERALAEAGTPRAPTQTLGDLAERLSGEPGVPEALAVLERLLYGADTPSAGELHTAAEILRAESDRLSGALSGAAVPPTGVHL